MILNAEAHFSLPIGRCHLCGIYGELTFEHSPPRAAYNDYPALLSRFDNWESAYGSEYSPQGRGGHVLCGRCNNRTGGSYGSAFVEWSRHAMERLHQVRGKQSLNYHGDIYPLRVLKQIATIFFATSNSEFRTRHPELERFVLDEHRTGLPPFYDFRVFWYGGGSLRQTGVVGSLNTQTRRVYVLSEFVHPPFGYVLSFDSAPPDRRPERIADFARYSYDERITVNRRFPVLETHWMMPGDYRTREEIKRDEMINALEEYRVTNAREVVGELERQGVDYDPNAI